MLTEHYKSKNFGSTMPKTLYSSTPIKPNFDPVSKHSSTTVNCTMNYEKIYPGIYMTSVSELCSPDDLKIYGFTHIIYIDKHIMENCIGSDVQSSSSPHNANATVKLNHHENVIKCAETSVLTASITIRRQHTNQSMSSSSSSLSSTTTSLSSTPSTSSSTSSTVTRPITCVPSSSNSSSSMMMDRLSQKSIPSSIPSCSSAMSYNQEMPIDDETLLKRYTSNENPFGHSDFETLDLNFGESVHFTANVLPNCYKAVRFIENALKNNGAVLVIDCNPFFKSIFNGENQKCITIVIGFLMYKYNKNFLTAYQLIKRLHPNIELDKFFTTQLYEYEPILQVQRSQSAGNSCSRELRSSLLKRKKSYDDCYYFQSDAVMSTQLLPHHNPFVNNVEQTTDILMEQ